MVTQNANLIHTGRGAQLNPGNRFDKASYGIQHPEAIDDWEAAPRKTAYIFEESGSLVNKVTSPDVGMLWSANPYAGCEHGCIYCYARASHEYRGFSPGLDFESKIIVKKNAPDLLRRFFDKPAWQPAVISLSGNTDCYQPAERQMRITRKLLEVFLEYKNPVGILSKNALVLRDLDIIQELNKDNLVRVFSSITSMDESLRRALEPRTATYRQRLNVLETFSKAGIPTGVMSAPMIPGLNDNHMHDILKAASDAGARWAGYTIVRLNGPIGPIFRDWLERSYPDRADKVWNLISSTHEGNVNDSRWGARMVGDGTFAELVRAQFELWCRKYHLNETTMDWNLTAFRRPERGQLRLF